MSRLASLRSYHSISEDVPTLDDDLVAYDTETSDADIWHGQILQFACIRATPDFRPLENTCFRIRRLPYIVPSPEAMAVTGIDPRTLDSPDLPTEYEASAMIERALKPAHSGFRTNLTYNGIKFDDGIIRSTQFRNLRDPYLTSGRQSTRVDLLPLVQMVAAGDPGAIMVDKHQDGRNSWRLESVCLANGIAIAAHDALGDAGATLALGRLVKERAPWAWAAATTAGNGGRIGRLLETAWREKRAIWHFEHFGAPDLAPCAVLGTDDKGKWLLLDLRVGAPAGEIDLDDVAARSAAGLRVIKASAMPLVLPHSEVHRFGPAFSEAHANALAADVLGNGSVAPRLVDALKSIVFEDEAGPTSERRLYEGFPSRSDRSKRDAFHGADWSTRSQMVFEDERFNDFAGRLLAMSAPPGDLFGPAPDSPAGMMLERARGVMQRPFAGPDASWMTIDKARAVGNASWNDWAESVWPDAFSRHPGP